MDARRLKAIETEIIDQPTRETWARATLSLRDRGLISPDEANFLICTYAMTATAKGKEVDARLGAILRAIGELNLARMIEEDRNSYWERAFEGIRQFEGRWPARPTEPAPPLRQVP